MTQSHRPQPISDLHDAHAGGAEGAPDPIQRLTLELGRLPGIGERTAARLAFYIIRNAQGGAGGRGSGTLARDLAAALVDAADRVGLCRECQNLCAGDVCGICNDARRDAGLVCVVEHVSDLRAIEASGTYRGRFHVLHGALAPLDGVGPDELKLDQLRERVEREGFSEVILATNADVEGDATALYLARLLSPLGVRLSRLASGVPMGGELEYVDQATLSRAIAERRQYQP